MFDGLLKSKFYTKCKSLIKITKTRLETIQKKRNATQKFLRKDIADLLKNGLDDTAYGRAEGLLVEQNMSSCYSLIEQFCGCIYGQLSVMQKQRECPEECREAVPSLGYAAARFADLPELRELRTMFTERYGSSLESFMNIEFVEKLRAKPPTKDMKLQLLHDIAQEFSIEWDSKALEQKLFKPPPPEPDQSKHRPLKDDNDDDGYKWNKSKFDDFPKRDSQDAGNKLSDVREYTVPKRNERDLTSYGRKNVTDDKYKLYSSSKDEVSSVSRRESTDRDGPLTSSSSIGSVSEDDAESRKPFSYRFIPPPYTKTNAGKEESSLKEPSKPNGDVDAAKKNNQDDLVGEAKPKPRSVRRRNLKPPPGHESIGSVESDGVAKVNSSGTKQEEARQGSKTIVADSTDQRDEEERIMDGLLKHYSNKQSPYESSKVKAHLKPPPSRQIIEEMEEARRHRSAKSELGDLPARAMSLPPEPTTPAEATTRHSRATSLQPEMLAGHVHPKLPDYDELAARLAALRR